MTDSVVSSTKQCVAVVAEMSHMLQMSIASLMSAFILILSHRANGPHSYSLNLSYSGMLRVTPPEMRRDQTHNFKTKACNSQVSPSFLVSAIYFLGGKGSSSFILLCLTHIPP